jgi:hypothetical protein
LFSGKGSDISSKKVNPIGMGAVFEPPVSYPVKSDGPVRLAEEEESDTDAGGADQLNRMTPVDTE